MKKINQIKLTGTLSMLIAGTIVSVNPAGSFGASVPLPPGVGSAKDLSSIAENLESNADLYKDMDGLNKLYDLSRSGLSAVAVPGGGTGSGSNVMSQKELKERMICDLEFVRNTFKAQYAPVFWKKNYQVDIDVEIEKAKKEISSAGKITVNDYQNIFRRVIRSMKDYHVGAGFARTESASLPFTVGGTDGKYFITWIDREKLPKDSFPFEAGDEVTKFGNLSAAEAVKRLQDKIDKGVEGTDHALASLFLTKRAAGGSAGGPVPKEAITISVKRSGSEKEVKHQLMWEHEPEVVVGEPGEMRLSGVRGKNSQGRKDRINGPLPRSNDMLSPLSSELSNSGQSNPFSIGERKSFIPDLGTKLWESGEAETFHSYIYEALDGKKIGYVRIPDYTPDNADAAVRDFAEIMNKFQKETDGLVIDQVNNPGGSVFYLYSLVSMLTDSAMTTPKHRIAVTQEDVIECAKYLKELKDVKNDEDARKLLGPSEGGFPVTYQFVVFLRNYAQFLMDEWNRGNRLTAPTHLYGVDSINPSANARYTKPVMVLVNELDFSGGDFFPAILQDNKRAVIFGARTAGAGGFVRTVTYPNMLGIARFSVTGSIAGRANGQPIENLGVTPDIKYKVAQSDLRNGFQDYVKAVNAAMSAMLK